MTAQEYKALSDKQKYYAYAAMSDEEKDKLFPRETYQELEPSDASGYTDDFTFDYGWDVTSTVTSGEWEIGEPVGTTWGVIPVNPDEDFDLDCSDQAYVTGNGGGSAGADDVDDGSTKLTSPVFDLTIYEDDPYISYHRWFADVGSFSGDPDDTLWITITNGVSTETVEVITKDDVQSEWVEHIFMVKDIIPPTSTMQMSFETADQTGAGNFVEAALDNFRVTGIIPTAVAKPAVERNDLFTVYPNPFEGEFTVNYTLPAIEDNASIVVTNILGQTVKEVAIEKPSGSVQFREKVAPGLYIVTLYNGQTTRSVKIARN